MNNISYRDFLLPLANGQRLEMVNYLSRKKEASVSDMVKNLHLEQSAVSHSLQKLRQCRFVKVRREGKNRLYSLNSDTIRPLLKLIDRHLEKYCYKNINGRKT